MILLSVVSCKNPSETDQYIETLNSQISKQTELNDSLRANIVKLKHQINASKNTKLTEDEIDINNLIKQQAFKGVKGKIYNIDSTSFKPYRVISLRSYMNSNKKYEYLGSGIMIIDDENSYNKLVWYYFDKSDFPPHTFTFIDFNNDGNKDLYMYSGMEDVYNSKLFINQINNNRKAPFKLIYENNHSYCPIIDIDKDGTPEVLNTNRIYGNEDIIPLYEITKENKEKINREYDRIVGGYDKYNFDYNMPKHYKEFLFNISADVNILKVKSDSMIDISLTYPEHFCFRSKIIDSLQNVSNEISSSLENLSGKYKSEAKCE